MKQLKEITLKVGETAKIIKGLLKTQALVYAGEVSDHVFSLVSVWTYGNNSAAYNLFFSKNQREIDLFGGCLVILEQSSRHIRFRFDKNKRSDQA
jgi:hypothetical protein